MPKTVNGAGVFGFVFALCGVGLLGASMGTTQWLIMGSEECGLFQCCTSTRCTNIGWLLSDVPNLVIRSILFFASLLTLISLLVALAALCGSGNISAAGGLNIVSGLFVLIGCGAFTGLLILISSFTSFDAFGYSFYLCWTAGGVLFIAGICEANGKKKNTNTQVYPATTQAQMVWATGVPARQGTITQPGQHQMALIKAI